MSINDPRAKHPDNILYAAPQGEWTREHAGPTPAPAAAAPVICPKCFIVRPDLTVAYCAQDGCPPTGSADDFKRELTSLLNRYCMENGSNTPDYLLADYLIDCLFAYNKAVHWRGRWHDGGALFKIQGGP